MTKVNDFVSYVNTGKPYAEVYRQFTVSTEEIESCIRAQLWLDPSFRPLKFFDVGAASGELMRDVQQDLKLAIRGIELDPICETAPVVPGIVRGDARYMTRRFQEKFDVLCTNFLWYGTEADIDKILTECKALMQPNAILINLVSYDLFHFMRHTDGHGAVVKDIDFGDFVQTCRPKVWWLNKFAEHDLEIVYDSGTTLAMRKAVPPPVEMFEPFSIVYKDDPAEWLPNSYSPFTVWIGDWSSEMVREDVDPDALTLRETGGKVRSTQLAKWRLAMQVLVKAHYMGELGPRHDLTLRPTEVPIYLRGMITQATKGVYKNVTDPYL